MLESKPDHLLSEKASQIAGSVAAVMAREHSDSALKKSDLFEGPRRPCPQVSAVEGD